MVDVVMPKWGLTMEEGTLIQWYKRVGDAVSTGEPLFEVETDKAASDVESPAEGILGEILADAGAVIPCGQAVGRIYSPEEWAALRAGS